MIEKEIELERKVLRGDIAREVITFEEAVPADSKYEPERFTTIFYKMTLNRFSLDIIISLSCCFTALGRGRLSSKYLLDGSDSESDNENKNEDDTDGNMPSKNFAILLVEKFIYEDSDKNFYLDEALKHKG